MKVSAALFAHRETASQVYFFTDSKSKTSKILGFSDHNLRGYQFSSEVCSPISYLLPILQLNLPLLQPHNPPTLPPKSSLLLLIQCLITTRTNLRPIQIQSFRPFPKRRRIPTTPHQIATHLGRRPKPSIRKNQHPSRLDRNHQIHDDRANIKRHWSQQCRSSYETWIFEKTGDVLHRWIFVQSSLKLITSHHISQSANQ